MRNIWLIIKREYLERVRTTSFVVLTLLAPAIMTVVMILPAKLATMGEKTQHIVVVTSVSYTHLDVYKRQVRISAAGLRESHVHDVMITREAPNYAAE